MLFSAKNLETLDLLCHHGADFNAIDVYGIPLLHFAIMMNGQEDRLAVLLKYGVDINAVNIDGENAVMIACGDGLLEISQMLLDAGCDIHHRDLLGNTALFHCSSVACMQCLLEYRADINARNQNNETALFPMCRFGGENELRAMSNVLLLIRHGIDIDATTTAGETALMVAAFNNMDHLAMLLISQNAQLDAETCTGNTVLSYAMNPLLSEAIYILMAKQQVSYAR